MTAGNLGTVDGTLERLGRLLLAGCLVPALAWLAYFTARHVDGDPALIDGNGGGTGVIMMMASVFLISRVASSDNWSGRAGISLTLSATYFFVTWLLFGDPRASVDDAPHLVWYSACIAAFSPAVVLIVASKWAWESARARRPELFSADQTSN